MIFNLYYPQPVPPGIEVFGIMFTDYQQTVKQITTTHATTPYNNPLYSLDFGATWNTLPSTGIITFDTYNTYEISGLLGTETVLFSGDWRHADGTFKSAFSAWTGTPMSIIGGSLRAISGNSPATVASMFENTFYNAAGASILDGAVFNNELIRLKPDAPHVNARGLLFDGFDPILKSSQFFQTFANSVKTATWGNPPQKLFWPFTTPAMLAFYRTFYNSASITAIDPLLFKNLSGQPTASLFAGAFQNCDLRSVPAGLFSGIAGTVSATANSIFSNTFSGSTSLSSVCIDAPYNLTGILTGAPPRTAFVNLFNNAGSKASVTAITVGDGSANAVDVLFGTPLSTLYGSGSSNTAFAGTGWSSKYAYYANIPSTWK